MAVSELSTRFSSVTRIDWQGWFVSGLLHAGIVALAVSGLDRIRMVDATEPFRLDVIVSDGAMSSTDTPAAAVPEQAHSLETPSHPESAASILPKRSMSRRPVQQQELSDADAPLIPRPTVESVPGRQQQERSGEAPSVSEAPVATKQEQAVAVVTEQRSIDATPSAETAVAALTGDESTNLSTSREAPELQAITSAPILATAHEDAGTGPSSDASNLEPQLAKGDSSGSLSGTLEPSASSPAMVGTADRDPAPIQGKDSETNRANRSSTGSTVDYAWLKRLLWQSIDRVKRYSHDALEQEWEGKVVMVVTIHSTGRIDNVRVARSSGNTSLDNEARDLIVRASPLSLERPLGAEEVQLRVPITFGLD